MCLFLLLLLFGPRLVGVLWWLFEPVRWNAAFGTVLLPVLGLIFLPWTTLMYLLVAPGVSADSTPRGWHSRPWSTFPATPVAAS